MNLTIDKSFQTGKPTDTNWQILSNIETVVACLPGASIIEKKSERVFLGQMAIKMGPINLNFKGEAEILEIDEAQKTMKISGVAKDVKGGGNASMELTLNLSEGESCELKSLAQIAIKGKIVQYGSRLIESATNSVFDKFVSNYKLLLNGDEEKIQTTLGIGSIMKGAFSGLLKKK